jgi:G:T/U-mismatch repair DNA glycosylase
MGGVIASEAGSGLTTEQLTPAQYERLLSFGIGLTDLVKGDAGADRALRFTRADATVLHSKLMLYQPWYFCFNGKRAAQEFFGNQSVSYGVQATRLGRTVLFVAPSTSAAANVPGTCPCGEIWLCECDARAMRKTAIDARLVHKERGGLT